MVVQWTNIQDLSYKTVFMLNSTEHEILTANKNYIAEEKHFFFQSHRWCIYQGDKCLKANNCWHFNIYEHNDFYA